MKTRLALPGVGSPKSVLPSLVWPPTRGSRWSAPAGCWPGVRLGPRSWVARVLLLLLRLASLRVALLLGALRRVGLLGMPGGLRVAARGGADGHRLRLGVRAVPV